jgi:hypothetical protein
MTSYKVRVYDLSQRFLVCGTHLNARWPSRRARPVHTTVLLPEASRTRRVPLPQLTEKRKNVPLRDIDSREFEFLVDLFKVRDVFTCCAEAVEGAAEDIAPQAEGGNRAPDVLAVPAALRAHASTASGISSILSLGPLYFLYLRSCQTMLTPELTFSDSLSIPKDIYSL